jgi:NADH-quinone oxidoreductase subunit N
MIALFTLSALVVIALLAEIFNFKKALFPIVLLGLVGAFASVFYEWNHPFEIKGLMNMVNFNHYALAFTGVICTTGIFWTVFANDYFERSKTVVDHFALTLSVMAGAIMLTSFSNLTMMFLGIEIMSIPLYVLAASMKEDKGSNEAGMKYFLMGSFATGFLLLGIALVYGATGSFDISGINIAILKLNGVYPPFLLIGVILILCALAFKVSAVPFHFWAPDVYTGSPTVITGLMSTIVKTAAISGFARLFLTGFTSISDKWVMILLVFIVATLLVANIIAAAQDNVKRMLAYSSVAHAGFLLMAIACQSSTTENALLYYTLAYSISSIGAFMVVYLVEKTKGSNSIESFKGLAKSNPMLAVCMTVFMLSLAGIPPTSGFLAKYYMFNNMLSQGYIWIVLLAVLTSLIGVYYYFKVIIAMFFNSKEESSIIGIEAEHAAILIVTALFTIALGLFPQTVFSLN